jgi:hypothetical protein
MSINSEVTGISEVKSRQGQYIPRHQNHRRSGVSLIELIIDEGGWIVAIMGLMLTYSLHAFVSDRFIYDDTPPISDLRQVPVTTEVRPGDVFKYAASFNKRDKCKVTRGGYNIRGVTLSGERLGLLDFVTVATGTWPVGKRQSALVGVRIPEIIPPGEYKIWWRYCWKCDGARREMCLPGASWQDTAIPVRVIPFR